VTDIVPKIVLGYDNNKDLINKIKENIDKKFKQNKIESNL
jgi:hypothetical protein